MIWPPRYRGNLRATAQGVIAQWNQVDELWEQIKEAIEKMAANPGLPATLRADADVWDRSIGGLATAISGRAEQSYTRIQHHWEGDAVDAYLAMLPAQREALELIKTTFSDPASTMLDDMATKLNNFWYQGGLALIGLLASIAGAAVMIALAITSPIGVALVVAAIVACIGIIIKVSMELWATATQHQRLLHQKLHDHTGYPDGNWPPSIRGG